MQLMAEHGDGNYAYVDDLREAAKVLFGSSAPRPGPRPAT